MRKNKNKIRNGAGFAEFEKTPVLSENDSEIRNTEVSVLTENEQQEIPLETVAETSKAEEKKLPWMTGRLSLRKMMNLLSMQRSFVSGSNESSSPSAPPAGALKNSSKEKF